MSPDEFGAIAFSQEDQQNGTSRYSDVRDAIFANPYARENGRLPYEAPTLAQMLSGVLSGAYRLRQAAQRTVASRADLRWGADGKGFRRIVHPYGLCFTGIWEIDADSAYTGYFRKGSCALLIARYSTAGLIRRGEPRAQAFAGKLYATTDPAHAEKLETANFFVLDDVGGTSIEHLNDVEFVNAPNVTPWRHLAALPILAIADVVFRRANGEPTVRQLYQIAELGAPPGAPIRAPQFMRLTLSADAPRIEGDQLDGRDEALAMIFDQGATTPSRVLTLHIDVTDEGETFSFLGYKKRSFRNWRRIGRIVLDNAVASYNGDHVLHFSHPAWREDRNNPAMARPH